nr:sigma-70 family RNA polymerase sigma factor [Maliibacterium massiliense]
MHPHDEDKSALLAAYVAENQARFYRLAYGYCKNSDAAMDIVQEAVVRALAGLDRLRDMRAMRTWFYRILVNEAVSYLRKNRRIVLDEDALLHVPHCDPDAAEAIALYQAIDTLDARARTVIMLRYFEDMKLEEIARVTATNINTVKSRLYAALEKLRRVISEDDIHA